MHIRPKHIIVLIIMLFTSNFFTKFLRNAQRSKSEIAYNSFVKYITDGFPAASEISHMDLTMGRVTLLFYLFLAAAVIIFIL